MYAEPHSMAEHFDALVVGAHAIGELPGRMHCKDGDATARVHDEEAMQVWQKILCCLDMRVLDRDLVVPTCLRTPTLILPTSRFMQLYFNPDQQGQYASQFPEDGQGFLQLRGDIRASIVPRDFRQLPVDVRELIDYYFHREELQAKAEAEEEESMSTDTEAAETVRQLNLQCSESTESLQVAVCDALAPTTVPRPVKEEYYYDSDDLVVDLDEQYPELKERIVQWQAVQRGAASTPPWHTPNFGQEERAALSRLPDLREILEQARAVQVADQIPVQSVAPMPLPFVSVKDLDRQCQWRHDQTVVKQQPSPLEAKHRKRAKTPPQPDPQGVSECGRAHERSKEGRERGRSRLRGEERQKELDKAGARSKSRKRSKSRRHRRKSRKRSQSRGQEEKDEPDT